MGAIPLMTAVANVAVEAQVMGLIAAAGDEVALVRRCVDIADMLAVAASGAVRVVLLSVELPGLDRDVVAQLRTLRTEPVAVDDHVAPGRAAALGITTLLPLSADRATFQAAVTTAGPHHPSQPIGYADPSASTRMPGLVGEPHPPPGESRRGTVVAVWGPTGAPGRSTVALTLADEAARLGVPTLLIDADAYGGATAPMLGLLDEAPGTAAACRLAGQGALDTRSLARVALSVGPGLRVLTGISRVDRWPELRAAALQSVLDTARTASPFIVIDCGFGIEQDEELAYDTLAPRRNAATLVALEAADHVIAVSGCDPVSVSRSIRALQDLGETLPALRPQVVINRLRSRVFDGSAEGQLREAFERFIGMPITALIPDDPAGVDRALLRGRPLAEAAPKSPIRPPLIELASRLTGASVQPRRRAAARR